MTETEQASLEEYLTQQQQLVDRALDAAVPPQTQEPVSLHKAMRYSLFAGGKRIRPILAISAAETVSDSFEGVEAAAAAVELIHTYSLIHDDLPSMDNDDFRRGRLTCHKVFGEAIAILAGDALCTFAFELLASLSNVDAERKIRMIEELARASGNLGGMIAGQVHDIEGERQVPSAPLLDKIHKAKTGALLRGSVRIGAVYGGATTGELNALSRYGEHVGLAFQIIDDILDVEQTSEKLGKTAGKDQAQEKITFPAVYGLSRSREMAEEQLGAAHLALQRFDERADRLRQLADFIVRRRV